MDNSAQFSAVLAELVSKFIEKTTLIADQDGDSKLTVNDLKVLLDMNDDDQVDIDDLKHSLECVSNFMDKVKGVFDKNQEENENNIINEEPEEFPQRAGPQFVSFVDDESGVVARSNNISCPRCLEYEKAFSECKKCEDVDKMRESYPQAPAPPSNSGNIINDDPDFDIEAQKTEEEPEKENKKSKVKRFLKFSARTTGQKIRPRDKSADKYEHIQYTFRPKLFPVGPL